MNQFIGDLASEKLDQLIEEVNKDGDLDEASYKVLVDKVELIGDDFIHDLLLSKLAMKYSRAAQLRNRERELREALAIVQKEIDSLER